MESYELFLPTSDSYWDSICCCASWGALWSWIPQPNFLLVETFFQVMILVLLFSLFYILHVFVFRSIRQIMEAFFPQFLLTILDPNRFSPDDWFSRCHQWFVENLGISLEAAIFGFWIAYLAFCDWRLPVLGPLKYAPCFLWYVYRYFWKIGAETHSVSSKELERHGWSYWWPWSNTIAVEEPKETTEYSWYNPLGWASWIVGDTNETKEPINNEDKESEDTKPEPQPSQSWWEYVFGSSESSSEGVKGETEAIKDAVPQTRIPINHIRPEDSDVVIKIPLEQVVHHNISSYLEDLEQQHEAELREEEEPSDYPSSSHLNMLSYIPCIIFLI